MWQEIRVASRREFLRFLVASPTLYATSKAIGQSPSDPYAPQVISEASDAINVFDFREVAKRTLMPGHYTYLALGSDDGGTLLANRDGFKKIQLRMRRLIDVGHIDTSIELFGQRYPLPVFIAPCASQKAFHPEGEIAVARAARAKGVRQILATETSTALEDVNVAHGSPVWFQLYSADKWKNNEILVRRAEAAGCSVLALTIDHPDSNREVLARHRRDSNSDCQICHATDAGVIPTKPMIGQIEDWAWGDLLIDWDFVDRLRDFTTMKVVLKGIVTAEDAELAVDHGVDGVIVSNHGGRTEDSGRSTIESLPEVVDAIDGRMPVIVDSGFRRGTDIFKALALGANAIAIGRPYLWGLSSFGQDGVEVVLDLLKRELEIVMRQARTTRVEEITRSFIA